MKTNLEVIEGVLPNVIIWSLIQPEENSSQSTIAMT
jgi:hypothetical protein